MRRFVGNYLKDPKLSPLKLAESQKGNSMKYYYVYSIFLRLSAVEQVAVTWQTRLLFSTNFICIN